MRFSLLLPILELALWIALVPTELARIYFNGPPGQFQLSPPVHGFLPFVLKWVPMTYSRMIIAVNLPAMLADAVISLPTGQPGKWHPPAISLDNWRSFVFPFYCLPAWWFAGCGLDALLGKRRLPRSFLWIGLILFVLFLVFLIGYLTAPLRDQADLRWLLPGFWLWTILFAFLPLNWLREWHTR